MPADHVIRPAEKFQAAVIRRRSHWSTHRRSGSSRLASSRRYPAEIFGYIHRGEHYGRVEDDPLAASRSRAGRPRPRCPHIRVQQFKEKPDAATAKKYVDSGEYYWNSRHFRVAGQHDPRCTPKSTAGNARPLGKNRRRLGTHENATRSSTRVYGDQADLDRLRRDGTCDRRGRDRSAVRVGRPGRLAIAGTPCRVATKMATRSQGKHLGLDTHGSDRSHE